MSMCIHRAIRELEEGADFQLPKDIKNCLISESSNLTIDSVIKGNPHTYEGLFFNNILHYSSKLIQNGKICYSPSEFNEKLPAVLIYSGILILYLPKEK